MLNTPLDVIKSEINRQSTALYEKQCEIAAINHTLTVLRDLQHKVETLK